MVISRIIFITIIKFSTGKVSAVTHKRHKLRIPHSKSVLKISFSVEHTESSNGIAKSMGGHDFEHFFEWDRESTEPNFSGFATFSFR